MHWIAHYWFAAMDIEVGWGDAVVGDRGALRPCLEPHKEVVG